MDIISAYREVGTYRGAAEICQTTHKTVRRVLERAEAGAIRPAPKVRVRNFESVTELVWKRVDKSKGLVKTPCAKPVLINAKLNAGAWTYTVASKLKLAKGNYRVSAYGTDASGGFGNAAPTGRRIVRFSLK